MKKIRRACAVAAACTLISVLMVAQQSTQTESFSPYTSCHLPEGPDVVDVTPLAPGIKTRTVQTLTGYATVRMLDGRRIMFAYPGEDFYANVKVEFLPADSYAASKVALNDNIDYLLASGDNARNYKLKPKLNKFEITGIDRAKREGGVLGVYLLFDAPTHAVITIYFLNQEPPKRFKTMAEYAALRDRFLAAYTSCIRANLKSAH